MRTYDILIYLNNSNSKPFDLYSACVCTSIACIFGNFSLKKYITYNPNNSSKKDLYLL